MITPLHPGSAAASASGIDQRISALLRSHGYAAWRAQVEASGGCSAPVHLRGYSRVLDSSGVVLSERRGTVLAPCGNRRESVCPACSERYCGDAFHLLRAGLSGDPTKGVPTTVTEHPRVFVTLTAPSFGPVHTRSVSPRGVVKPCPCGQRHTPDDIAIGTARHPDSYDYTAAVLWQAHAGMLWARFTTALRRALAAALGITVRSFASHARLSFAKVAEYQKRGLVHFHAVVRVDGPDGPADPPPAGLDRQGVVDAIRHAASVAMLRTVRPDGSALELRWGRQIDVRPVTPSAARQLEDPSTGEITDQALAGYIAKYATKGTGTHDGADRPIRDVAHVDHLPIPAHHRRMMTTAWELGGHDEYAALNLRKWAHMLAFRGHFLTKSRRYSVTFAKLRGERRAHRLAGELDRLNADRDEPHDASTVVVINEWWPVRFGHRTDAERELAEAIGARQRTHRRGQRAAPTQQRTAA